MRLISTDNEIKGAVKLHPKHFQIGRYIDFGTFLHITPFTIDHVEIVDEAGLVIKALQLKGRHTINAGDAFQFQASADLIDWFHTMPKTECDEVIELFDHLESEVKRLNDIMKSEPELFYAR